MGMHGDGCDCENTSDRMRDVVAFIKARQDNDIEAGAAIMGGDIASLTVGLADMNLAFVKLICDVIGIHPRTFVASLYENGVMMGDILERMSWQ